MTIAACYVSTEGVVLGADSTSTVFVPGPEGSTGNVHHFNFAQKIFEFGENSSLGIVTWGLGSLGETSHRTVIADVADECAAEKISSVEDIAALFAHRFFEVYASTYKDEMARLRDLDGKGDARTEEETNDLYIMTGNMRVGFCLGGCCPANRKPQAYELSFDPLQETSPDINPIPFGVARFWGCPNLMERLIVGMDFDVYNSILKSGKWDGSPEELFEAIGPYGLAQPFDLPIREAIDWIHASIYITIKMMKFSHLAPVCGGPVEVGVITSDRRFRWVCHKSMSEAISQNPLQRDIS